MKEPIVGGKITRYPQGQGKYDLARGETQPEVKPAQKSDQPRSQTSPEARPARRDPPKVRPARRDPPEGETGPEVRPSSWRGLGKGYRREILEDPETLYKLEIQDLEVTKKT